LRDPYNISPYQDRHGDVQGPKLAKDRMSSAKKARQTLVQSLAEYGTKAFKPDSSHESRVEAKRSLDELVQR